MIGKTTRLSWIRRAALFSLHQKSASRSCKFYRGLFAGDLSSAARRRITRGGGKVILMSNGQEATLGDDAYRHILRDNVITHDVEAERSCKVGERIATAANKSEYKWEFTVINDPEMVNAFAVPGVKSPSVPEFLARRVTKRVLPSFLATKWRMLWRVIQQSGCSARGLPSPAGFGYPWPRRSGSF